MKLRTPTISLLATALAALAALTGCTADTAGQRASRRLNAEGNERYEARQFADAEASYTKAVDSDAANMEAKYNLALSMVRQATQGESGKKLLDEANGMFRQVTDTAVAAPPLASQGAYNMGNIAYNAQQWDQAIEAYKKSLRLNPDDDAARENLRLAQLKKKEQQQNNDNKQQDDKKDQDQQQQQQQQQQQEKDKQQPQQPQQPQNNEPKQQPQQPQQPQGAMSDENAEKILKAMENEEAATRRRVQEAEKRKAAGAGHRVITNPW